jgi:hypothetical protein
MNFVRENRKRAPGGAGEIKDSAETAMLFHEKGSGHGRISGISESDWAARDIN